MSALLRYQAGILFRSHRWIFPLILYVLLISVGGVGGTEPLGVGLDWSAAMLLPTVALLTRSMLTAEPDAARACVAAAAGPVRAQLAVLIAALSGGVVLTLAGTGYELITDGGAKLAGAHPGLLATTVAAGLGKALICAFVGSAVGTFFNRPVIRHPAVALLATIGAVVVGLVSSVSPASAALRGSGAAVQSGGWPTGAPFGVAVALLAISWLVSARLAARRSD